MNSTDIYNALNVSDITDLIDSFGDHPAIFSAAIVPQEFSGNHINYYTAEPISGGLEYTREVWTINCRADTQHEALSIAASVFLEINRKSYSNYFLVCDVYPVIPPQDTTDQFNCVVEATLKKR